jgi:hypothetical protein
MAVTSYKDIIDSNYNLAPSQLMTLGSPNKNKFFISDLLSRKLKFSDNGNEVGSVNYISKSPKYFIRAKALQKESFLPFLTEETAIPIRPQVFTDFDLKAGDILISKDSNIGEAVILDKDLPNHTISGALYKLPVKENKYYLFAFLKHKYFLNQLDLLVPKGSTIRHAKNLFLDCKVPFPNQKNKDDVICYVEFITQAILNKEKKIRRKHEQILEEIKKELLKNQKDKEFRYIEPSFNEIKEKTRLDTHLYIEKFKKNNFLVKNYKHGGIDLINRGYKYARGTSLEIKSLGTRIDSDTYKKGFCELVTPTDISEFGTINQSIFIGTPKKLKTIKKGDIIFGGEGFKKGRTFVVCYDSENIATNYHGIRIYKKDYDLIDSIFIRCFLAFWREQGMIDYIGVGGSGGHCAPQYFGLIETPLFPQKIKQKITSLYHNPVDYPKSLNLKNFLEEDQRWNERAGIVEIDKSTKQLKKQLNSVLDKIVNNEIVNLEFV